MWISIIWEKERGSVITSNVYAGEFKFYPSNEKLIILGTCKLLFIQHQMQNFLSYTYIFSTKG